MNWLIGGYVGILGLVLGSFVNALVWRVHEQTKKLNSKRLSILNGRSMCPSCKRMLAWYDLIPVVSWITLKGKCRYCKEPISWQYPLVEVITGLCLVASYIFWPLSHTNLLFITSFALWSLIVTLFVALAVYDIRWMLLPNRLVYPFGVVAIVFMSLQSVLLGSWQPIISGILGVSIGIFFWLLYQMSGGKWIGGGDVRLGFILGILLGWQKGLIGITLASYIGLILILIIAAVGKYKPKMHLPFGPLLIGGAFVAFLFGDTLIQWYLRLIGI